MAWGHPVFKAGTKTFAAIEPVKGRPSIAFRLEPVDVDLLLSQKAFFETPYGRGLWVSTWADTRSTGRSSPASSNAATASSH